MNRAASDLERRRADVAARKSIRSRRRSASPFGFILLLGAVASAAFLVWAMTTHDASLAVLGGALVALATIYLLIASFAAVMTYRASSDGRAFRALVYAIVGGGASIVGFVGLAVAYVMLSH